MEKSHDLIIEITDDEIVVGISVLRGEGDTPVIHRIAQPLNDTPPPNMDGLCRAVTSLIHTCAGWSHMCHDPFDPKRRTYWRDACVLIPRGWLQKARISKGSLELMRIDIAFGLRVTSQTVSVSSPDNPLALLLLQIARFFVSERTGSQIKHDIAEHRALIARVLESTRRVVADNLAQEAPSQS